MSVTTSGATCQGAKRCEVATVVVDVLMPQCCELSRRERYLNSGIFRR